MFLWAVQNGYRGYGYVTCLLEAADETAAIETARPLFKAKADKDGCSYEPDYWEDLTATAVTLPAMTEIG